MAKRTTRTTGNRSAAKRAPARKLSAEEREVREGQKHAPVSLPSGGSFDREKLQTGLDKAVDRTSANREEETSGAIEAARDGVSTDSAAPNALPGHRVMRADVQFAAGSEVADGKKTKVVGEAVSTEYRQVFDADNAADAPAPSAAVAGIGLGDGAKTEILSLEPVDAAPSPPSDPSAGMTSANGSDAGVVTGGTGSGAAVAAGAGADTGSPSTADTGTTGGNA